ncbi:cache domain-containing protein [Chthonobacter rhizosphaerae]|uniref:cache domain-containing protein n=1 Tax=Chthonobacter rhizosphaerae TaxID=2735553 RepID=UPI0015EEA883|nr:cache domain-containing protein [Chthonobacter rhizosphaerae]
MAGRRLSLSTLIFLGGAALLLVPAVIAGTIYTGALQRRAEAMTVETLKVRGDLSANLLARRLHQLWQEVEALSRVVSTGDIPDARRQIDMVSRLDRRYSWIGFADTEGRVTAATAGMLEGATVAERPWFRRGLTGPTAIDVHEALLLAKLLPATNEPWRFIDFAAPVTGPDGAVSGVIGAHLDWRWVADNVASLQAPGIDVILVSRDGTVLLGPPDLVDKTLTIGSVAAASRATMSVLDERWPDGKDYVTVTAPTIGHEDLPSFGWSLLIRQDVQAALQPTRELVRSFWITLGAGAIAALGLLALGARLVTTPLRRLVTAAEATLGDGLLKPPHEETRYEEAARLSDALTRLQSTVMRAETSRARKADALPIQR